MAILIAYWGDDENVAWVDCEHVDKFTTLFGRLEERLTDGFITEILEYWPDYDIDAQGLAKIDAAIDRWRAHLKNRKD